MRGQQDLIKTRMSGRAPSFLNVDLDMDGLPDDFRTGLIVQDLDRMSELDFRCVVGLLVAVSGTNAQRVKAVADECAKAGADRVIATTSKRLPNGQFETTEVTDTHGEFTWKS